MASPDIVAEVAQSITDVYFEVATNAIVLNDFFATFPAEVELIWKRELSSFTAVLFLLNRYNTLLEAVLTSAFYFCPRIRRPLCKFDMAQECVSNLVSFAAWAGFCALRIIGIGNNNTPWAVTAFTLGMVPFCINLYVDTMEILHMEIIEGSLCTSSWILPKRWNDISEIATRVSLILCDLIVLYVTLSKTYISRKAALTVPVRSSLRMRLMKDGTIYFGILLVINVVQVALWVSNKFRFFAHFTIPLSSIIMSHFILDIRETYVQSMRHPCIHLVAQSGNVQSICLGSSGFGSQPSDVLGTLEFCAANGQAGGSTSVDHVEPDSRQDIWEDGDDCSGSEWVSE